MKKIILFFVSIFFGVSVSGQLVGDGLTPITAYCGTITNAQSWTVAYNGGTIYVGQSGNEDLTITTGGSLTIEAGVIVRFCTTASDLIITNNGILTANGSVTSNITFTKDTQATWGHISFQNMIAGFTSPSIINYCIVEFGRKNSAPFNFESAGGGIQTAYTNLTISNSVIRNNYAGWGGGIYVNANASPVISNTVISNNTAGTTGGGMSIYQHSAASLSNCIIRNNTCNGGGGGGGVFVGDFPDNVRFYNCNIVSNISTAGPGNNIRIWKSGTSTGPRFFNTIVWGSTNSINYYLSGSSLTDFNYCAIQGYVSGYTSCINLNAVNNDPLGPNFTNPSASDYSITFLSPVIDLGTSTGAPLTDFIGNPRVGGVDIGAYENQEYLWQGDDVINPTFWNIAGNWNHGVLPTQNDLIIVRGSLINYPVVNIEATVGGITIAPGANVTINPGFTLVVNGTLTNNAGNSGLILKSDATGDGRLINNTPSVPATVELFLTGGNPGGPTLKLHKWHFISTPVSSLPVSTFAPVYTENVVGWYDNQVAGTLASGWIAYDGFRYATGVTDGPTFDHLSPGPGYDFYAATDQQYTFTGLLNTSNVPMSLSFAVNDALHGFNLLGNPFPCGLNWDDIINNVYFSFPANTSKSLFFTRDNVQCSYISGVGIPGDVTGIIPPMQGFFVKTYGAGNSITIPTGARVSGNIHPRYKGDVIIPLVRLQLAEGTTTDETVVRLDVAAKSGLDYDFDAVKMFLSADLLSIYSTMGGINFAINGLPFPETFIEIPVNINLTADGNHSISALQVQGLDNYDVTLTDNTTGFVANLKTTPVITFSGTKGTISGRFVLKIGTIITKIENPSDSKNIFNIYPGNGYINIQTISDDWNGRSGSVKVLDLTGKTVTELKNTEFTKNSVVQISDNRLRGLYILEIRSGVMRYAGKVVIR